LFTFLEEPRVFFLAFLGSSFQSFILDELYRRLFSRINISSCLPSGERVTSGSQGFEFGNRLLSTVFVCLLQVSPPLVTHPPKAVEKNKKNRR